MNEQNDIPVDTTAKDSIVNSAGILPDGYLPKDQRKTILLLSDDLRLPSGVGTMSKELVLGTCHKYSWVQIGAGISHPEAGKVIDMCEAIAKESGVSDAFLHILPCNGYGDAPLVRKVMNTYKIDAIVHFTDPRYWLFLYQMEHEIRTKAPICYLNLWDDLPYPKYNRDFYRSCDALFAISKQSFNINKQVLGEKNVEVLKFKENVLNG